jgi:hypothetical protein
MAGELPIIILRRRKEWIITSEQNRYNNGMRVALTVPSVGPE